MILKQSNLWFNLFTIFLFYASDSAKSRSQDRLERHDIRKEFTKNTLKAISRAAIPKCQWLRFQELPLKVQQGAQSAVSVLVDNYNQEPVIKKVYTDHRDFSNELKSLTLLRGNHNPLLVYPLCVDPMKMILVLEWGGDDDLTRWDLFRDQQNAYTYNDVVKLAAQIVGAVGAAHRRGILHGDIKPENFVIDLKKKSTKLIDFGLSAKIGDFRVMTQGTPVTMAPEVAFLDFYAKRLMYGPDAKVDEESLKLYKNQPQKIKEAMDWWSVGVTIHYLFAKFFEDQERNLRIAADNFKTESSYSSRSSSSPRNTSNSTQTESPSIIIDDSESDDHYFPYKIVWTTDGREIFNFKYRPVPEAFPPSLKNLLEKFMVWEPSKRNFVGESLVENIVKHEFFKNINWYEIDSSIFASK